jgi:hypothetical protein
MEELHSTPGGSTEPLSLTEELRSPHILKSSFLPHCFYWPDLPFWVCFSEVELPLKKDGFTSESTTLEALLRGEGVEKKVDAREEESIQETQVLLHLLGAPVAWSIAAGLCIAAQGQGCSQTACSTTARVIAPSNWVLSPTSLYFHSKCVY